MAAQAALEHELVDRPTCWCCGNTFDEAELSRLGSHPEVGVCAGCAQWLHRRARSATETGRRNPGSVLRRAVAAVRRRVMRAGAQDWPVLGSLLRRLDRHLP
ncbi:hypothetical protein [Pedococcus sp. P5_B7]